MIEIHQILPQIAYGDAISNHVLELRKLFRSLGYLSEIYVIKMEKAVSQYCKPFHEFKPKDSTVTFYHYSIGNDKISKFFRSCKGKKVLVYHNITPHHFFQNYSQLLVDILKKGRESLGEFSDVVDLAIGDSEYNVEELRECGYKNAKAYPILLNFEGFKKGQADPEHLKYLGKSWTTFLFTGRVVPNKAHHDVISTFAWYNRNIDPLSRLIMIGAAPFGRYLIDLNKQILSLGLSERIFLPGRVSFSELIAYYKTADIFLCLSEHEGFCVPLLEAMFFDIPIIAFDSTGVTHTMGDAGVLVKKKDPVAISEIADLIVKSPELKNKIVAQQRKRLGDFQYDVVRNQYQNLIQEFLR